MNLSILLSKMFEYLLKYRMHVCQAEHDAQSCSWVSAWSINLLFPKAVYIFRKILFSIFALSALVGTAKADEPLDLRMDPFLVMPSRNIEYDFVQFNVNSCINESLNAWPAGLTLQQTVNIALCKSPDLKLAWSNVKQQAATLGETTSSYWPSMNASLSYLNTRTEFDTRAIPTEDNTGDRNSLSLSWRILDFGARKANRDSAVESLEAVNYENQAAVLRVLSSVVATYFDVMKAQSSYAARQHALETATSTLLMTERRKTNGVASLSDVVSAEAALSGAKVALYRAESSVEITKATLKSMIGWPAEQEINLVELPVIVLPNIEKPLMEWWSDVEDSHPSILAAKSNVRAANYKVKAVVADGQPSLDLSTSIYRNGYPNQSLQAQSSTTSTFGITLNIPIFGGYSNLYQFRGAQAKATSSQVQLEATKLAVMAQLSKVYAEFHSANKNLGAAVELKEKTKRAYDSSRQRYNYGAADIQELLGTQSQLFNALEEYENIRSEWHSSRMRLYLSAWNKSPFLD